MFKYNLYRSYLLCVQDEYITEIYFIKHKQLNSCLRIYIYFSGVSILSLQLFKKKIFLRKENALKIVSSLWTLMIPREIKWI